MKLSSQKDLLLIIILSGAVLIMGWLKLIKGYPLSLLPTILVLFLPGYALLTAIWPNDERMGWTLRGGLGFAIGLFFILFLPLILNSLKWESITSNLNQILLILTIVFSLVAMARRKEPLWEEESPRDAQLTLEESIQRAALMRQKAEAEADEYEDYYDEEHYESEYYEEHPEEDLGDGKREEDEEPQRYQDLKEEKPLQYERLKDRYSLGEEYLDEEYPLEEHGSLEDHEHDEEPIPKGVPLQVEEPVKVTPGDYESEMDRPVWLDEPVEKKPGFRNWDLVMILFLSGVSLLFLYFNPLKTTTTSIIFFILLLFILGYAGLTIIYPDKSRVSTRNLTLTTSVIAIVLFMISFLAWWMHLLPEIPKYLVQIMFVASVILSAGAFIRKWRATHDVTPTEEVYEEEVPEEADEQVVPIEEVPVVEEPLVTDEKKVAETPQDEVPEKKDPLSILKSMGKTSQTTDIIDKKEIHKEPPAFQPRNHYMDIIMVVALTILTAAFVLIKPLNQTFIRTILGILLVLFIPGYSLIAALFPKWGDLDGIERAALSFGLSIAVTPLIGLALNYTPWGIRLDPILISLTMFTMAMCLIAFLRRRRLPEKERYFVPFGQFVKDIRKSFQGESKNERILSIILIISILLAISTTAYIIVKPKEGEKFTEFYILGPDGKASNYPTNLTTGQNGSVIIGVVNHEYTTTDYLLMVKVNNSTLKNETLTLTSGQKMEIPFNFTAGTPGQKKMEFLLYKLPNNETAYRSLHLWLNMK
ncbi:DUF1616 domain-containing protein [Methanobacterium formicicum]|uniref:DUF1616 domain-containing protein n=1 Tax=Methanobacterium formicicum TaxID=2162 RepID=A0A843ALL5_METFO|nr:DUF1616 domain-containing protein [Methanobacterium formicicum]MBF4475779.1 DUF1616 domain-containing protein [Methanobacterium formicicum]